MGTSIISDDDGPGAYFKIFDLCQARDQLVTVYPTVACWDRLYSQNPEGRISNDDNSWMDVMLSFSSSFRMNFPARQQYGIDADVL